MTFSGYMRRVFQLESEPDDLLSQPVHNQAPRNLKERFLTHRDKLLVFLHDPGVPPTNNESERALRTSLIHRKVTNCFRSEWGAKPYVAVQSVIATARFKVENILAVEPVLKVRLKLTDLNRTRQHWDMRRYSQ